jgi:aryl-alcohol dehydrogenase-like predicted oxidoreductase
MDMRRLGRSDLMVSPLCFGGNVFGWTADEATSFRLLDGFMAAGCNFIDTADVYSRWVPGHEGGESEVIIGNWMKARGNRSKVVLATKLGSDMGQGKVDLSPAYMERAVEASLKRLRTDHIDLYQSHRDDPATPIEATLGAYKKLVDAGKVRVIGASNFTPARLVESLRCSAEHGLPRYESLQPEYNLMERAGFEAELEGVCQEHGLGVITYFSLASGFLTGKYRSEADLTGARGQSAGKHMNERGRKVLAALDEVAKTKGATPARVALAWLIHRPSVTAPIASATSLKQLEDLVAAPTLDLEAASIARLDAASA